MALLLNLHLQSTWSIGSMDLLSKSIAGKADLTWVFIFKSCFWHRFDFKDINWSTISFHLMPLEYPILAKPLWYKDNANEWLSHLRSCRNYPGLFDCPLESNIIIHTTSNLHCLKGSQGSIRYLFIFLSISGHYRIIISKDFLSK